VPDLYAAAASNQQAYAFTNYWKTTLQQSAADLPRFMSAIVNAPILLPFDGTNKQVSALFSNSTSTPFPPPLACYPGLSSTNLAKVNTLETTIFGLSNASTQSSFQQSCYADRPIYGVLDLFQLRHPFLDSRTGAPLQAVTLQRDTWPRAVVYSGEALAALPGATDAPPASAYALDPRQYGTLANLNHVLMRWFGAIGDVALATAAVQFVLAGSTAPPANASALATRLAALPPLEVALFGAVLPADVAAVASAFAAPGGALWFGADAALAMRQWALTAAGAPVVWATNATAALVVRDASLTDPKFLSVWTPAEVDLRQNPNLAVSTVTDSLASIGLFTT
jgi:hypothetical protein